MEENQQHKGWFGRNWKWAVPTGCGIMLLIGIIAIVGGVFWGVTSIIQESDGVKEAMSRVQQNEIIISALGEPIEISGMTTGNIRTSNGTTSLDVTVPIKGPDGTGVLKIIGNEQNDVWSYQFMEVHLSDSNETVNLLDND